MIVRVVVVVVVLLLSIFSMSRANWKMCCQNEALELDEQSDV